MPQEHLEVTNEHGRFQLTRAEESQDFVCDRCLKPRRSRVSVWWHEAVTDRTKTICNGCYGQLRSGVSLDSFRGASG